MTAQAGMHTTIHVTEDLMLSSLQESDVEDLIYHINDPVLYENTLTVPYPYLLEHAKSYLEHVREFEAKEHIQKDWVLRCRGTLIGGIGALYNHGMHAHKTEIGYWISREYRGTGIMTRVVGAFVDHLFSTTNMIRIEAHVFTGNRSSARVLEKNQFILEGTLRAAFLKNGRPRDAWLYARVKPE